MLVIEGRRYNQEPIKLPAQFRKVETLRLYKIKLTEHFLESVRYLTLSGIKLDPNFDWTKLTNLTKLYLNHVNIIKRNFIEFLRQRPKLESFSHDQSVISDSEQNVFDALARMSII